MKRSEAVAELQTELKMRRKVWKNVPDRKTGYPFFALEGHQKRYDVLNRLLDFMDGMTDKEYADFETKIAGRKAIAQANQPTLF